MTIVEEGLPVLDDLVLGIGAHANWESGACVMEAVAYLAGEPFSDHPKCASRVIGTFLRSWNDSLNNRDRQVLKQYIPRLVGSKGTPEQEETRGWMAVDWLVRTHTPMWLRLAGLPDQADRLTKLSEFQAGMDVAQLMPTLKAIRTDADAARETSWTASGAAPGEAHLAAGGAAARAASRDASGAAPPAASRDATPAVARAAAGDAAADAAWAATRAATRDASPAATRAALRPTVVQLQASAHELVDRMLNVTETVA